VGETIFGPTGEFPRGKLSEHDEGELIMGVRADKASGVVLLQFGVTVTWVSMTPSDARTLAMMLSKAAAELDHAH